MVYGKLHWTPRPTDALSEMVLGLNLENFSFRLSYIVFFVYDLSEKITKKEGEQIVIYQNTIILFTELNRSLKEQHDHIGNFTVHIHVTSL